MNFKMSNTVYNKLKVFGSKTGLILFKNWFDNNAPKLIKRYEAIQLMKSNNKELIYNIRTQWNPIYSILIELTEKFPHLMLILESNSLDNDKTQITIVYQSNRIFPLLIRNIKKKYNFKELGKIWKENNTLIFNLEVVMEADVRKLNDRRKELSLKIINEANPKIIHQHQSKIEKLKTFLLSYVNKVYTPIIKKYQSLKDSTNSKLEQFCFAVVDEINAKLERVTKKFGMDISEFYFDDDLELLITVRNNLLSKFPLKSLDFDDLETKHKKVIIQILKTEL